MSQVSQKIQKNMMYFEKTKFKNRSNLFNFLLRQARRYLKTKYLKETKTDNYCFKA